MYKEQRQNRILEMINSEGAVDVNTLSDVFDVSVITIRRDLGELDRKGYISRTHGGAINSDWVIPSRMILLMERINQQKDEKQAIAKAVAKMVRNNEKIYIGSGTTAFWVAKEIMITRGLTVVTHSLPLANLIARNEDIVLIMIGGFLRRNEYTFVGHIAEKAIQDLHLNKVIIGIRGIHPDHGLTSDYPQELMTDRAFLNSSENVIVIADHTKFGFVATSKTAPITAARTIVTSRKAPYDMVEKIKEKGVEVLQV